MKSGLFIFFLLVMAAVPGIASYAQNRPAVEQSAVVRITAPRQNFRQTNNFVDLRFELTNATAAAASSPNFNIQIDSNDPVKTTSTQQSFTGFTPGNHVITVQLVDANGRLVPDSQAQVQFTVVATTQNGGTTPQGGGPSVTQGTATAPQAKTVTAPRAMAEKLEDSLPPASSSLPILSIVGFGVLVGGVISAMRTR